MATDYDLDTPLPDNSDAADLEIKAIFADTTHPYHAKRGHPLRDLATKRVTQLFEIKKGRQLRPTESFNPEAEDIPMQQSSDFDSLLEALSCG